MRFALCFLLGVGCSVGCSADPLPAVTPTDAADLGCVPRDPVPPIDGGTGGRCNCNSFAKPTKVTGKCTATVTEWSYEGGTHEPPGTNIVYCTNPPSSGPHYFTWAAFKPFAKPVAHGYLVHSMEHGAVVLWYKCKDRATCPDLAKQLEAFADGRPADPKCDADGGAPRHRIVVVPDPDIPTQFAASAHQWTYTADCFDEGSLGKFVDAHYGHGIEDFCTDGIDPSTSTVFDGGVSDAASDG